MGLVLSHGQPQYREKMPLSIRLLLKSVCGSHLQSYPLKTLLDTNQICSYVIKAFKALSAQKGAALSPIWALGLPIHYLLQKLNTLQLSGKGRTKNKKFFYKHPYPHCIPGKLAQKKSVHQVYRHAQCTVFVNIAQAKRCADICTQ